MIDHSKPSFLREALTLWEGGSISGSTAEMVLNGAIAECQKMLAAGQRMKETPEYRQFLLNHPENDGPDTVQPPV